MRGICSENAYGISNCLAQAKVRISSIFKKTFHSLREGREWASVIIQSNGLVKPTLSCPWSMANERGECPLTTLSTEALCFTSIFITTGITLDSCRE